MLKPTGSIYLHCDPTASHYLKMLMDAVFGPANFANEVIWKRTSAHSSAKRYRPVHDMILFYAKTADAFQWNPQYEPYEAEYVETFFEQAAQEGPRTRSAHDRMGPALADGVQFVRGSRVLLVRHGPLFYCVRRWSVVTLPVGVGAVRGFWAVCGGSHGLRDGQAALASFWMGSRIGSTQESCSLGEADPPDLLDELNRVACGVAAKAVKQSF